MGGPPGRRIPWLPIIVGVAAIGFLAVGVITAAQRNEEGEITQGGRIHWTELAEGDCFNFSDDSEDVIDVDAVPCAEEHVHEVFWVGSMPSGDYPSEADMDGFADDNCLVAFESYVGLPYDDSVWFASYVGPAEDAWSEGERGFICHLFNSTETPVTGSARGSER